MCIASILKTSQKLKQFTKHNVIPAMSSCRIALKTKLLRKSFFCFLNTQITQDVNLLDIQGHMGLYGFTWRKRNSSNICMTRCQMTSVDWICNISSQLFFKKRVEGWSQKYDRTLAKVIYNRPVWLGLFEFVPMNRERGFGISKASIVHPMCV